MSGPAGLPRERLTVAVPVYRAGLDADEEVSLASTFRALGRHHLVMVKPEGLDTAALEARFPFAGTETFAPEFFRSIAGYNRLLLSAPFYERFRGSEYLLVCQLDVFVFRDDLAVWVARGHDYVGAPWLAGSAASLALHWLKFQASRALPGAAGRIQPYEMKNRVGNGGFSLRKVETHRRLGVALQDRVAHYLASEGSHHFHEDVFWALEPGRQGLAHRTPTVDEALAFAFDVNPAAAFRRAGGTLPMAAHGWYKGRHRRFWAPHVAAAVAAGQAGG